MLGKIARLPRSIRDQLNRRLDDAEPQQPILDWLNSLPETQALLATRQNLYEWTQRGFRNWKMRQDALAFAAVDTAGEELPPGFSSASILTDKLVHWLTLRYAATAHSLPPAGDDPETDLRRLRNFTADIVALRRGDLYANRIALEQKRLALLETQSEEVREAEFWEWTKRPDIRDQLGIQRQNAKAWRNTLRSLMPEAAAFLPEEDPVDSNEPDETLDPAVLI